VSLAQEARQIHGAPGPRCTLGALILALPPDEADDVVTALADESLQTNALWRAMKDRGYDVPATSSVARHRRGMCNCA